MSWIDWDQTEVLAERYLMAMLGRLGSLALFLLQGPIIAVLILLVWRTAESDPRLELFLCIAAQWIGTLNACREIGGEWALFARERAVFLGIPSYVLSKVLVLVLVNGLQTMAMLWILTHYMGLRGSKLLLFLVLFLASAAGTCLGLLVSALASGPDKAVAAVPLVVLPQLLLSAPFRPSGSPTKVVESLEKVTPLYWSYELYKHVVDLATKPAWGETLGALVACMLVPAALFGATCGALWVQDE